MILIGKDPPPNLIKKANGQIERSKPLAAGISVATRTVDLDQATLRIFRQLIGGKVRIIDMTAGAALRLAAMSATFFLTIIAVPPVVLAQTAAALKTCIPEIKRQCGGAEGEVRRTCIKSRFNEFSLACQLALVKLAAVKRACKADVKTKCPDILPGGGRVEACIKDHFAEMSAACKETISQAAGKS